MAHEHLLKEHTYLHVASGDTPILEYRRLRFYISKLVTSRFFQKWCSSGVVSALLLQRTTDFTGFFRTFRDIAVVVEDSRTGERVLGETLEKLSGFRYEELLRHEIDNFYIVKRTLYVQMKNPPEIQQPREFLRVCLPAPLDQYLVEHGVSPELIKVRDGVLYAYAFKEVETEVRRWMQDKYHRSDLPLIAALDPETGLPMIRVTFYE